MRGLLTLWSTNLWLYKLLVHVASDVIINGLSDRKPKVVDGLTVSMRYYVYVLIPHACIIHVSSNGDAVDIAEQSSMQTSATAELNSSGRVSGAASSQHSCRRLHDPVVVPCMIIPAKSFDISIAGIDIFSSAACLSIFSNEPPKDEVFVLFGFSPCSSRTQQTSFEHGWSQDHVISWQHISSTIRHLGYLQIRDENCGDQLDGPQA